MNWYHRFKPMLAADCSESLFNLRYPVMGSFKIDGIRCSQLKHGDMPLTRSLKYIPNNFICAQFQASPIENLDLELVAIDKEGTILPFNETSSAVMSQNGTPSFRALIHDYIDPTVGAMLRYGHYTMLANESGFPAWCVPLKQRTLNSEEEVRNFMDLAVTSGYEGIMLKDPNGFYKFGRSTLREGKLLKLKSFKDSEAIVLGYEELQHNINDSTVNALGYLERSSHKAGLVPGGTLGKLLVKDKFTNVEFAIGSGFTAAQRHDIWSNRSGYLGKMLKYKSQDFGVVEKPRTPIFLGWRFKEDIS